MSFESPDVEGRPEPFPRLYQVIHTLTAGNDEGGLQGSQEDIQVRRRDLSRRKEGARRDRKDKGYVMFEQEDSDDELVKDSANKSPRKVKKHTKPTFKFTKKEKPNKAKEKEKEKDKDEKKEKKEKDKAEKEKEKQEKDKEKKEKVEKEQKKTEEEIKPKWRKKILAPAKQNEQNEQELTVSVIEDTDAKPIFGVSLALAVERSPCHDGIQLPVVVRQCIDYIEEFGLSCEGIYRMSGVKSKVQSLKDAYNKGLDIYLQEHEPNIVASLLKQFLRQLPEPLLTAKLMPKFEQASANKNVKQKVEQFLLLLEELPPYNSLLLSWVIVHMTHVIAKEKENKMSLQNVSIVLSPTLQISHRVLNVLFTYSKLLFKDTIIKRYVPPLKPATSRWTLELPESPLAIEEELKKQESLLNHLHEELMKVKDMEKEEQLWEVQRIVTQLKRRLKHAKQTQEAIGMSEKKQEEIAKDKLEKVIEKIDEQESQVVEEVSHEEETVHQEAKIEEEESSQVGTSEKEVVTVAEVVETDVSKAQKPPETDVSKAQKPLETDVSKTQKSLDGNRQDKNVDKESSLEVKVEMDNVALKVEEMKVTDQNLDTEKETKKPVAKDEEETRDEDLKTDDSKQSAEAAVVVSVPRENVENDSKEKLTERTSAEETEENDNAAGDVGLPDAHRIEEDKTLSTQKQEHMGEEDIREPVSDEVLESVDRNKRLSTATDDSSDAYTDVLVEDDEEEEQEECPEMTADAGKGESLNVNYVQLNEESPMEMRRHIDHRSEEDLENKQQDNLNVEDSTQMGEEDQDAFSDTTTSSEPSEFEDNEEYQQLEQEHTYLTLEEEELLAIGNELRQKIAAERNEIDRLQQDIVELKQMRQDMFETSASSSSLSSTSSFSDSDEELDDDDLRDLLKQLIKENSELELENAGLCDKIHQERQICIAVKVQNRMIQQRHLESSGYGFDILADQESLL